MIQEIGTTIKDMEVVISSKLDQGFASLFSLLTYSSGERDLRLFIAQALRGETLVDIGIEVTYNQEKSTY